MTNDTRRLIRDKILELTNVKQIYYKNADSNTMYPHIVFDLESSALAEDLNRKDYTLYVDLYFKDAKTLEDTTDSIEKLNGLNLPQDDILPTFYWTGTWRVEETDKTILHNQIRFSIQNYERR